MIGKWYTNLIFDSKIDPTNVAPMWLVTWRSREVSSLSLITVTNLATMKDIG